MTAWDILESPLDPEPVFHIDAPDADEATELERQAIFVAKARRCGFSVVAVPNGGKRGQGALNQARREGAAWGFPDLIVMHGQRIAFLEFKNARAKPKLHQVEWLNRLAGMGYPCGVFRRADSALAFLMQHGFPVGEVRRAA